MDMSIIDAERALCAACDDLEGTVLGYEIWSMLEPDAVFDITKHWWTCSPLKGRPGSPHPSQSAPLQGPCPVEDQPGDLASISTPIR
jgi:hypothetical protein